MKIKLLLITILWSTIINAQEKTDFTLQEAIDYALENAYAIQTATNNIELADEKVWETTAIGLPQINGNVDYQNFLKQQVQLIPSEFFLEGLLEVLNL